MAGQGVAEPPPSQTGWPATMFGLFFFFFGLKKKKKKKKRKCDGGILGIKMSN
jgi:hypothetical protein